MAKKWKKECADVDGNIEKKSDKMLLKRNGRFRNKRWVYIVTLLYPVTILFLVIESAWIICVPEADKEEEYYESLSEASQLRHPRSCLPLEGSVPCPETVRCSNGVEELKGDGDSL